MADPDDDEIEDDDFEDYDDEEDDFDGEPEEDDEEAEFESLRSMTVEDTVQVLAAARLATPDPRWLESDGLIHMPSEMRCRVCGCTEDRACDGGCLWAAPNLCSRCVA